MSDAGSKLFISTLTAERLGKSVDSFNEPDAVLYESQGNVAVITLNRPHATNRISMECVEFLHDAWVHFERSDDRVAVFVGEGEHFCNGGEEKAEADFVWWGMPGFGVPVSKPIIGAAAGGVHGGGFTMAMTMDLLVAAENTVFHYPEARYGLAGGLIGSLAVRIPHKIAMEIILLTRPFSAQRAYEVGFVNTVVPNGQHLETAMEYAREIAANGPLIVRWFKKLVDETLPQGPGEIASRMRADVRRALDSADSDEALAAYHEGRTPIFRGV